MYQKLVPEAFDAMGKMVQQQKTTLEEGELGLLSLKAELGTQPENIDSLSVFHLWNSVETLV
jgi:hypothetical protein